MQTEAAAKIKSGETTPDNQISLLTARCIGACGIAPAVVYDGTAKAATVGIAVSSLPGAVANLGIAVDIGTTTLVVVLVDLTSGRELAVASALIALIANQANPASAIGRKR